MIIIRVELHSAITGKSTELARMSIVNDGTGTERKGNYDIYSYRGRDKETLDKRTLMKQGKISGWNRKEFHVWNLVRKALKELGYTRG